MITLILLVRATYMYGVVLHAHRVRGESHNQRNTTGEVATMYSSRRYKVFVWFDCIFVITMPLTKDLYRRMSAKEWSEWRWTFSFSGVENLLLLHIMCGTKRLNPCFRLHEASEVLNKYVIGVWQARRQDFAASGAKNHKRGQII